MAALVAFFGIREEEVLSPELWRESAELGESQIFGPFAVQYDTENGTLAVRCVAARTGKLLVMADANNAVTITNVKALVKDETAKESAFQERKKLRLSQR